MEGAPEVRGDDGRLLGGRYRLHAQIGEGGMGIVYEAIDEVLSNRVAVKVLRPSDDSGRTAIARLHREARAAAALGHPNIVRVTDLGRDGDSAYLVMELLRGRTLDEELHLHGSLPLDRAVRIHLQLLDALGVAHQAGVLHRDIKPSNIFLTRLADGSELVKLLDFGLAYLLEERTSAKLTATGIAIGTPAYMAPERIYGEPIDGRADLFSVGVSFFESLTGQLPFAADNALALRGRILLENPRSVREDRPDVSEDVARVIERALAKRAVDRFPTAAEMAHALAAAIARSTLKEGTQEVARIAPPSGASSQASTARAPDAGAHGRGVESSTATDPTLMAIPPSDAGGPDTQVSFGDPMAAMAAGSTGSVDTEGRPATLRYGGVTVPPGGVAPVDSAPRPLPEVERATLDTTSAAAYRALRTGAQRSSLIAGLALGAGLGVLVLGALGIYAVMRDPTTSSHPSASESGSPAPAATRAPRTPDPEPPAVGAALAVTEPPPAPDPPPTPVVSPPPPVEEPSVASQGAAPVEETESHRPSHPPRVGRRRTVTPTITPQVRPLVTPVVQPPPPSRPPPRNTSFDGPLEPDWSRPPRR
ncbi:MAG: serine/threonine-protein kinase [Sandaracinaceae bacterium]